jgi:signal transduction histidine kinase/ligand-binding sensor domain-containing protein
MIFRFRLLSLTLLLIHPVLFSQKQDIRFQRLSLAQGLSQSSVFSIAQDHKGFMWFATQDGLDRYDGYSFSHFSHEEQDSTSLSDNYVNVLLVDRSGILWAGTQGGGLDRYIRQTGRFVRYTNTRGDPHSLSNNEVRCLYQDHTGTLWIGTTNGLDRYMPGTQNFARYMHDPADRKSLPAGLVECLFESHDGNFWVGMLGAVALMDRKTGAFTTIPLPVPGALCVWIAEDDSGNLWIAMQNELYLYRDGKWTPASAKIQTKKTILARRILNDGHGTLWFGADDGLHYFNEKSERTGTLMNDPSNPSSLSGNSILSLFEDKEGILWVGTYDGINKYAPAEFKFEHVAWNSTAVEKVGWNKIRSFCEDRTGRIWVATQEGLMTYDRSTGNLARFNTDAWYTPSNSFRLLWSLIRDRTSPSTALWIGTNGQGLIKLDVNPDGTSHFKKFAPRPGDSKSLSGPSPVSLYETRDGTLWVGTLWEGLDRLDKGTGTFKRYVNDPSNPESISGNEIWAMCEDRDGFLWIGTAGEGLNKLDIATGKCTRFFHDPQDSQSLSDNMVLSIVEGDDDILWIGTYTGLNRFDPRTGFFEHFTTHDGLPNDVVYGIVKDNSGNLWLSTNKGLSRFAIKTHTFRNFDAGDGLQSNEFNHGAAYRCKNGEILFGGVNGFNIFSPDSLAVDTNIPAVVFTDFKVFNKTVIPSSSEKRLTVDIADAKSIHLSYKDAVLSIDFAALDYTNPEKNQYAYFMQGFDKDWVYAGKKREATYTNLDPGKYIFKVKATNSDGLWNGGEASVELVILPPYWQAWWFRTAVVLVLLSIGPLVYYRRVNSFKKKQAVQQEFSRRLIESQEAERKRVASELHDSIGQDLLVIKNKLLLGLQSEVEQKESSKDFREAVDHVSNSLKHVREISRNLRPLQLDQIGLTAALEAAIETAAESSHLGSEIEIENIDNLLSKDEEINLFRIVQESLNNILKHAHATALNVKLVKTNKTVILEVSDNGQGMDGREGSKHSGLGISSMNERARILGGELKFESNSGKGTKVILTVALGERHHG